MSSKIYVGPAPRPVFLLIFLLLDNKLEKLALRPKRTEGRGLTHTQHRPSNEKIFFYRRPPQTDISYRHVSLKPWPEPDPKSTFRVRPPTPKRQTKQKQRRSRGPSMSEIMLCLRVTWRASRGRGLKARCGPR